MQTGVWRELDEEFDAWANLRQIATLWWRDDDAIDDGERLVQLLRAADTCPISLAVVSGHATARLAKRMATIPKAAVLQHGWSHASYAQPPNFSEYPGDRRVDDVRGELREGRSRLLALFDHLALPVFVPPFDSFDDKFLSQLAEAGLRGISRMGPRATRALPDGFVEANVHIPLHDWHKGCFRGEEATLGALLRHLRARRRCQVDLVEPVGILTHHLVQDDRSYEFMTRLLAETNSRPGVRWLSGQEVFGYDH